MTSKENAAVIRRTLRQSLEAMYDVPPRRVSVRIGQGTARHWIEIRVGLERQTDCVCSPGRRAAAFYDCTPCDSYLRDVSRSVQRQIDALQGSDDIHLQTYPSDDGQGQDRRCLTLRVGYEL